MFLREFGRGEDEVVRQLICPFTSMAPFQLKIVCWLDFCIVSAPGDANSVSILMPDHTP